ncbi:hypothetical protein QTO34_015698 [Cnephaeus nilssonii]|uniref:Large ribosomal subunit protein P2 n=1 Tax=Cnephaeus nilssonii TaxID=3371016 RepID=A0AA40LRF1_CNENI|nr:hypothetical protein QTO34_015698 [Eptesicus nilssonii]
MDAMGLAEPWGGLATKNLRAQCGFRPPEGVLAPIGIDAVNYQLNRVISELNGKNNKDAITQGIGKLDRNPAGRVRSSCCCFCPSCSREQNEKEEESDDDMGFGLFD